ncbi:hypothetical protein ACH4YO_31775 [Streptomyces noursei]|uniref:hypothetical protein n=1 Tax=Streptomyces noursei TaxID=1971 RepID=UPI0013520E40
MNLLSNCRLVSRLKAPPEGGRGVHEGAVVLAGLVESVGDVDVQAAEPGGEAVVLVVRGEAEQAAMALIEQGGR